MAHSIKVGPASIWVSILLLTRLLGIGQPQQVNSSVRAGGSDASVRAAISFPAGGGRLFGYPASFIERRYFKFAVLSKSVRTGIA